MPVLLTVFAIVILLLVLGGCGEKKSFAPPVPTPAQTAPKSTSLSRSETQQRLKQLATAPAPTSLNHGAMCYDSAGPALVSQYLCPKCGNKSVYPLPADGRTSPEVGALTWELQACKRQVGELKDIELDESQFCKKCSPNVTAPKLVLVVRYEDRAEPHRAEGVTHQDLAIVQEFLSGKTKHMGEQGRETALKDYLKRLQFLLGIEIDK
ncbi:MAG TPA: hypothetical protein VGP72_11850 [Planctomycetota bacterium]|jgi:hypothetical protein